MEIINILLDINFLSVLGAGMLFIALLVGKLKNSKNLNLLMFIITGYLISLGVTL